MGKLSFKGDKPKDKKRKHKSSSSKSKQEEEEELDGWLPIPFASLALGPLYITLPPTPLSSPLCLALQPTLNKVIPHPLPTSSAASTSATPLDLLTHEELDGAEIVQPDASAGGFSLAAPTDVHHVWVCTRIPDTQDKVTLRSALGRFLAGDELGRVTADREARGLQEEWTIAAAREGGGFVLRSAYGKVLSVDQMAGGKMEVRCEGEEEDQFGRWGVMMQGEYVSKAKKQLDLRMGIKATSKADGLTIVKDLAGTEAAETAKYQARGQGRLVTSAEDIRDLKRAKKEGKLGEALLERRVKLKAQAAPPFSPPPFRRRADPHPYLLSRSDKYC